MFRFRSFPRKLKISQGFSEALFTCTQCTLYRTKTAKQVRKGGGPLEEEEEKPKAKKNFIIVIFEDEMDKMTGIFVCSARFQIYGKGFPRPVIMLS